jgi:hypothetical protein
LETRRRPYLNYWNLTKRNLERQREKGREDRETKRRDR